jgi:hypothetical protein
MTLQRKHDSSLLQLRLISSILNDRNFDLLTLDICVSSKKIQGLEHGVEHINLKTLLFAFGRHDRGNFLGTTRTMF